MKVKEVIDALSKMDPEADVIMFDGPGRYTPSQIYKAEKFFKGPDFQGCVIID